MGKKGVIFTISALLLILALFSLVSGIGIYVDASKHASAQRESLAYLKAAQEDIGISVLSLSGIERVVAHHTDDVHNITLSGELGLVASRDMNDRLSAFVDFYVQQVAQRNQIHLEWQDPSYAFVLEPYGVSFRVNNYTLYQRHVQHGKLSNILLHVVVDGQANITDPWSDDGASHPFVELIIEDDYGTQTISYHRNPQGSSSPVSLDSGLEIHFGQVDGEDGVLLVQGQDGVVEKLLMGYEVVDQPLLLATQQNVTLAGVRFNQTGVLGLLMI